MKHKLTPADYALWAALPMAHTSKVEGRIAMILDTTRRRTISRRALIFGAALTAVALVPLAMLKPMAKAQTPLPAPVRDQQEMATLHLSDAQKQLRLAQAHQLRGRLAEWAHANKAALVQMQQARPDDLASLMRVYDSLIKLPFPLWNGDPRVGRATPVISSYVPDPTFSTQTTALTLSHLERSQEPADKSIREDFARYHDFRVARSIDPGNVCIVVWASGRITESTVSGELQGRGKPFLALESQKFLMPGFFPLAGDKKIGERIRYSIVE